MGMVLSHSERRVFQEKGMGKLSGRKRGNIMVLFGWNPVSPMETVNQYLAGRRGSIELPGGKNTCRLKKN